MTAAVYDFEAIGRALRARRGDRPCGGDTPPDPEPQPAASGSWWATYNQIRAARGLPPLVPVAQRSEPNGEGEARAR